MRHITSRATGDARTARLTRSRLCRPAHEAGHAVAAEAIHLISPRTGAAADADMHRMTARKPVRISLHDPHQPVKGACGTWSETQYMATRMLIDARHREETRVAVVKKQSDRRI